jgi:hypothetical protein
MSRKNKRQVRRDAATTKSASFSFDVGKASEFTPDYSSVIKDLRRIGILAGSFIFLLVVLSFFLR